MAKGKHSVALFEVIQSSRSAHKDISLRTPNWWFKRRDAAAKAAATTASALELDPTASAPAPRTPGVDLKMDPDRQRITFQLSYTSAIIAAFAVIVTVGLAIIIGQRLSRGPAAALAGPSTEQLRKEPAKPEVLNLNPPARSARRTPPDPKPEKTVAAASVAPISAPPPTTTPSTQRIIGQNYVLVQGWPAAEKAMAIEACDFLNKNGIPCTVEQNLRGFSTYTVIGLRGFDRPASDPAYAEYEKSIRALSEPFAKTSKFKRFSPSPIKWSGPTSG
jgi:hypothetical protein